MKAVIKETGLSPATLRAWERRYKLFKPLRSPGGHRLYTEDEIQLLKWLVEKQKEGLRISRAVALWRSQEARPQNIKSSLPGSQIAPVLGKDILNQLSTSWYEACLEFNEPAAELAVAKALAIATPEVVCEKVLQNGLAEIGRRWYSGTASIQQEHFAAALAARRINALFAIAPVPTRSGRLIAACPPGEQHDLALLMLAFILRWQGWEVIYLGADIPLDQLDATLEATMPDLVISAAQTLPGAASLVEFANYVNHRSIPLAFGGGIFNQIDDLSEKIPGFFLGQDVNTAPRLIEDLLENRITLPASRHLSPEYANALASYSEHEAVVLAKLKKSMQFRHISSRDIERANSNFSSALKSALTLGEMHLLDYSVEWLNGLLENHGVSPDFAIQYYQAFYQALKDLPTLEAEPVLNWLSRFV